ncbi:pantoate--beta-alanine ligase [Flavobacterium sp. J372]|uniref:pantoate--beta-alanine ligase n=1 Tax=Flavobacterium sp. J372 TaxID=2898436 RepID=UPI00215145E1|nr:pantoate--beta-alanine ligase [Flavobacterium sp. J372]MCR5860980.1 pantoate--beta-alanine ligase [Flavobacterium sp. J372]
MLIFNNKASLNAHLVQLREQEKTIGFVPTMGALHKGHLSLIERSDAENDITVISIFVNPTQFNNAEDLEKYPRTLERDIEKIDAVNNAVIVFAPTVDDMYEGNTVSGHFSFDGLENQMEGKHRPGHFDGVGTIVKKLFEAVEPDNAYFGEKDFQQLQIVRKMVEKEGVNVKIIGCPIYREPNGLAMSSRNERLSNDEREEAGFIYKTLIAAKERYTTDTPDAVRTFVEKAFQNNTILKLEYFEIADEATLMPVNNKTEAKTRAFIAVIVGNVRLIDNISLN